MTQQKTLKARVRRRMAETGETYLAARAAILGMAGEVQDTTEVDAVVLKVNQRSVRVRIVGEDGEVTFRSSDVWRLVPGHLATLNVTKRWEHRGSAYASGRVRSVRIDVSALGLEPLPLEKLGMRDLAAIHEPFRAPDPYAPMWRELTARPRPAVEFHAIAWQGRTAFENDPDDCPITDAA